MNTKPTSSSGPVLANLGGMLVDLETLYKDVHAHPELPGSPRGRTQDEHDLT